MKNIYLFTFLFFFNLLVAQNSTNKVISISFNDLTREAVLQKMETEHGFQVYYIEDWFKEDKELISGNYSEKPIKEILNELLKKTNLNFYLENNRIILTKNSIIYDKLPENYFNNQDIVNKTVKNPIFFRQFDSIKKIEQKNTDNITLIGKESTGSDTESYTLEGYIKDLKTGKPIQNVTVKVKNTKNTTSTDNQGYYTLKVPQGLITIETETEEYKRVSRKIMVYSNGNLDLQLKDNTNILDEVIVKGRRRQNIRTSITGVTTIEAEGIKNTPLVLGERDVLKIALTIPGIKTAGEGSAGFNVRGGKEDQNLILLDNGTLYNPAHFFGFFSAINPYATNKVDIYKGSIPTEYGGRLSSVFDIISKNGNTEKIAGEAGIGPVTSNLTISTPLVKGKASLLGGFRATYSGWILRSLKEEQLQKSEASFYDGIIKYHHDLNKKNSVEATFYYSKDAFSITSDSVYKYSNRMASIKWKHTFNEKNKGEFNITNSEYKFNIAYNSNNPNAFDYGYKINETQGIMKFNYTLNDKNKFSYGISSKLYTIDPGNFTPRDPQSDLNAITIPQEKGLESALFVSDNLKINKKLLFDIGFRYSIFAALGASTQRLYEQGKPKNDATVVGEKTYGNNEIIQTYGGFEPRISMRYMFNEDFSIKAGFDKTFQYIHLLSSNTTQSPTDTWKLSDLNVKPQNGQQFSLGLFKNIAFKDLEFSLEGYYKKSNNILDYKTGAQLLLNENIETELLQGEGKSYGMEFLIKKQTGQLNGWVGYTYSRTFIKTNSKFAEERVNNGKYFAANFDKPHDFSAVLNYKFTKRYSLSGNFVYQTGRPITYPIGKYTYGGAEYTLYSDRNKYRIPDYYRLDIGFNIEGNHKLNKLAHSFWNISIYNVLGRNNPYSVYFITTKGEIKAYKTSIFGIPVPTITYNFKF
ncbi:TonB-dependent receptor [Flavobacterium luminosum]|uniref:TonB-dependent receptor n=1 Tax=Flavobacterium luminosum TaxID=2949086 RepID=A0ABT0TKV8_9FLAO|nr:carboxypeptidase-like regulatory domain-containing protein [Flavobacterium sp. HXWNR70]MCL9807975.1 TonB-dependent receptor [Flavobacterium sp. HXWNR70]